MIVEKGLLRETHAVHRMLEPLLPRRPRIPAHPHRVPHARQGSAYSFPGPKRGHITLLEHYFKMSYTDTMEALAIYRHFCTQTEHVVQYLGVARKLQNLLDVAAQNLKHAPVSLASVLQKYLDDPAFEQNRIEYRTNKEAVKCGRGGVPFH
ncbi:hypothetical protein C8R44DRAFT_879096 [Mycena epipterygia]|nr:hypothetical protein C8R44DRAFT_879096 [Mycena epipterygia]